MTDPIEGSKSVRGMFRMFFVLVGMFALACIVSLAQGCGTQDEKGIVRPVTEQEQAVLEASNDFGFDFFREVVGQSDGDNVFVSPLSVSMALGMTYNGARGATEEGMRAALRFGELSVDDIIEGYRGLIDLLTRLDPKVKMEIANSIWIKEGFDVLEAFVDVNRAAFDALVSVLDFTDPGAVDTINAWVSEKTHGKIDEILESIDPVVVMILINAVYFKGDWTVQFDKGDTRDGVFHAPAGDETVKMMNMHADLAYLETDTFQAVDLEYGDGLFSMTVLLPKGETAVDDLAADLTAGNWATWKAGFTEQEGDLSMPRFELEYETVLNDVLKALGMEIAFEEGAADFSGIHPTAELFISRVKHKSYVRVDEEGTEAAAVTSVEIGATSVPQTFVMTVDRPFLFVISDAHSGTLLFVGKIVDPPSS
jgi:serpin B